MTPIFAVDYGTVDGNAAPDFKAARAQGAGLAIIKRYQSPYGVDGAYARDAQRARDAGLVVGSYLFPDCRTMGAAPKAQVAGFAAAGGEILKGIDLPPALDVEFPGGITLTRQSKTSLLEMIRQLVFEMQDQLGVHPMIYTSWNQWYDLGLPAAPWLSECPLWVKTAYRLGARQPVDAVIPPAPHVGPSASDVRDYYRIPGPWANSGYVLQQHQGDAVGFGGFNKTVDLSYFHVVKQGSVDPLVAWAQRRLDLPDDGNFGPHTQAGVMAAQQRAQRVADGVVDPATFAALAWL